MFLQNIILKLISNDPNLKEDDIPLIYYGLTQGFFLILNLLISLTIGILCGVFLQCFWTVFLLFPLRIYAGGYHAQTRTSCFFISIFMILITSLILRYFTIPGNVCTAFSGILTAFIWKQAPLDTENKRLDDEERKKYRKKTHIILLIHALLIITCITLKNISFLNCIFLAQGITGILLFACKMKMKR